MNLLEATLWTVVFGAIGFGVSYVVIKLAVRHVDRRY